MAKSILVDGSPRPPTHIHQPPTAMMGDGSMGFTTNATFDAWFQAADRFFHDVVRHKTIFPLLIARCVGARTREKSVQISTSNVLKRLTPNLHDAYTTSLIDPDDRKAVLEALVRVFFTAATERESLIVKVSRYM